MDALKIERAIVGGCDWEARTANILAALWSRVMTRSTATSIDVNCSERRETARCRSSFAPIVMNTQEQLQQAFEELREGTFLNPRR